MAAAAASLALAGLSAHTSAQVVISQVNGNGGLNNDVYEADFVELFNRGTTTVDLTGWSIHLGPDSGTQASPWTLTWSVMIPLEGTIQPGQYYLIRTTPQRGTLSSTALFTSPPLPEPDIEGDGNNASLVSNANAVALMSNTNPIASGSCPVGAPGFVDLFRYGFSTANCFEGSAPAPIPASTTGPDRAAVRFNDGCNDTDDSAADIITVQTPNPRNTYFNAFVDAQVQERTVVTGTAEVVRVTARAGTSLCNPLPGALTSAVADLSAFGLSASQMLFDNGTNGDVTAGDGVFSFEFTVPASQPVGRYNIPVMGTSGAVSLPSTAVMRVFPPLITNTFCTTAEPLSLVAGVPVSYLLNTRHSDFDFLDAGTCDGNGVGPPPFQAWFSWTPTVSGAVRFDERSRENIIVSIHLNDCSTASSHCINDEAAYFEVSAGTPTFIRVARETASLQLPEVPVDVEFEFIPSPANDDRCSAETIPSFPYSVSPLAPAYTPESDPHSCNAGAIVTSRYTAWYKFTAPAKPGLLTIRENSINSIAASAFVGDCSSLVEVGCGTESSSQVRINIPTGGTEYHVVISVNSNTTVARFPYDLTFEYTPVPDNDNVCDAQVITGLLPLTIAADARAATDDIDPGTCNGSAVGRFGIWYEWTAPANGSLYLDEFTPGDGTGHDIVWGIWEVADCFSVFSPATRCMGNLSGDRAHLPVTGGNKYFLQASVQTGTASVIPQQPWILHFDFLPAPINDEPCDATLITSFPFMDTPNNVGAQNDVDIACNFTSLTVTWYGVWYTFTPDESGYILVAEPSSSDSAWGLFTGPDCNSLTEIACRDGGGQDAVMYFAVEKDVTYHLLGGMASSSLPFAPFNVIISFVEATGGCCTGSSCVIATRADCDDMSGTFLGEFSGCFTDPNIVDTNVQAIPNGSSTALMIPGILETSMFFADNITIQDIKVGVDITHTNLGDLRIILTSPDNVSIDLVNRVRTNVSCSFGTQGSLSVWNGLMIFDDDATNPWGDTLAIAGDPFGPSTSSGYVVPQGRYKPTTCNGVIVNLNSTFAGQSTQGLWTLTCRDERASAAGTLNGWQLYFNGGTSDPCNVATPCPGDFNGDNVVDLADLLDFLGQWNPNLGQSVTPGTNGDINSDGVVDLADLLDFLGAWNPNLGQTCP